VVRCGWIAHERTPTIRLERRPKGSRQLDSERCIDAERNAGDNGNACSENTCTAVDAPEPGHGPGIDRGNQSHAGRKSKAHQETCRRQHKDAKAGANDKVRSIEAEHERQPERQRK
jgi:hypothetical protein